MPRLLSAALALALIAGVTVQARAQFGPAPVVAARVVQRDVAGGQTFVGTVTPAKRSAVGSAVDGRVVDYPINIGDRVVKGQPLCQLLTETISIQIAAAEAELRLRAEELRELQNGSRPEEIAQAEAKVEALQALRDFALARYKRFQQLAEQGQTITLEQLEQSRSASIEAERMLNADQQMLTLLVKGPREEKIAQAQARKEAQAELVQQLKDQLKKHAMVSPFDGYVVTEQTEVGEWVTKGQVVAEVVYLDDVEIEAHVLDAQIDSVRVGQTVRVELPALKQPLFVGTVAYISPQGDVKSRTFPVRITVKNQIREDGPAIKAGMMARVTLPVGQSHDALLLPKDAVVFGGPSPVVYVVEPAPPPSAVPGPSTKAAPGAKAPPNAAPPADPNAPPPEVVRPVPVVLGIADGNLVEVTGDLKPGDRVVTLGNERLRPMAPVNVIQVQELDAEPSSKATSQFNSAAPK
jgi:multidrug efflux pump subunit AcrA (membrane-fusion protein)